jgi:hypothetical protein
MTNKVSKRVVEGFFYASDFNSVYRLINRRMS